MILARVRAPRRLSKQARNAPQSRKKDADCRMADESRFDNRLRFAGPASFIPGIYRFRSRRLSCARRHGNASQEGSVRCPPRRRDCLICRQGFANRQTAHDPHGRPEYQFLGGRKRSQMLKNPTAIACGTLKSVAKRWFADKQRRQCSGTLPLARCGDSSLCGAAKCAGTFEDY